MSKALIPLGLIGVAGVMGSLAGGEGNRGRRAADLHDLTKRELRARLNKLAEKRHDLGKRLPIEKMSGHVMPLWINDDDGFRFKSTDLSKRDYTRMSANYYKLWQEEGAVEFILRDGEMEEDPEEYHQAMMRSARGQRAEKRPSGKAVRKIKRGKTTYSLYKNGELWTGGRHAYMAGYVMDPENIDYAIDVHEEEMRHLHQEAMREFGLLAKGRSDRGRRAEKKPAIWGYINWTEGRQRPIRYSMPVYSAKQAYRTEAEFADWHPSKKRVSISRKKPRNARPVPQHDQD